MKTELSRVFPNQALQLALFALVFISISRIHQHFTVISVFRPGLTLLALACLFAIMRPNALRFDNFATYPVKLVLFVATVACLSVPFGLSMGNSAKFLLEVYFRVLLLYGLVALSLGNSRNLSQLVWTFVFAVAVLCWMAIFVFRLGEGLGGQQRLGNMYMYDANDLGVLLLMGVPLTFVCMETSGRIGKWFGLAVLVGIAVSIARSGSRGAFVGLLSLVGAYLVWAHHISISRRVVAIILIAATLWISAPPGYWDQMRSLQDPTGDYNWDSESGRRKLAQRGLGYMMRYPLTGVGIDNFNKAEWQISSMAQELGRQKGIRGAAAHNTWVQIGAELGVTGLVLWLSLLFGTIFAVARTRKQLPVSWKRGPPDQRLLYSLSFYLPLAIWAFAVPSTFVSHAYMDPMYYLAALSAGYLVAVRRELQRERVARTGPAVRAPRNA